MNRFHKGAVLASIFSLHSLTRQSASATRAVLARTNLRAQCERTEPKSGTAQTEQKRGN